MACTQQFVIMILPLVLSAFSNAEEMNQLLTEKAPRTTLVHDRISPYYMFGEINCFQRSTEASVAHQCQHSLYHTWCMIWIGVLKHAVELFEYTNIYSVGLQMKGSFEANHASRNHASGCVCTHSKVRPHYKEAITCGICLIIVTTYPASLGTLSLFAHRESLGTKPCPRHVRCFQALIRG